jgi:hypothetical protein
MASRKSQASRGDDIERGQVPARSKKKKKPPASRGLLYAGIAAGGLFATLLLIGVGIVAVVVVVKLVRGTPEQPVTAWDRYTTDENEFGLDYPAGWNTRSYGLKNKREVNITHEGASITIKENLTGSLLGDIAGAANQGRPVDDDHIPVAKVHELRRPEGAREESAVTVMTKAGKARRSLYTDGSNRGYRATVLLHQTALDVFCECRESDWETLRPAFDRVIASIGRGDRIFGNGRSRSCQSALATSWKAT